MKHDVKHFKFEACVYVALLIYKKEKWMSDYKIH